MRLLLIEDDATSLNVLAKALELEGYECTSFQSPVLAVEAYLKGRFDAVITDVKMPVMDGLEVLRVVRDVDPRSKVVIITGHADLDIASTAMNRGAYAFFVKPYDIGRIVSTLRMIEAEMRASGQGSQQGA